jgi:hypothetical protein
VAATNVTAVWDLTANKGITKDTKVSVRAFGIEMVFVPEGPFYLGSGGIEPFHFYQYTDGTQHTLPYRVTSAGAIPTGRQPGKLWARKGAQPEDGGEIPAAFPNGYEALYCMKFHITAAQYVGFLNALPREQASERAKALQESWPPRPWPRERGAKPRPKDAPMRPGADGQPYTAGRGYVGVSWADGAAFAAWAGLRPMTELEYEKACRGPMEPGWDTGDDLDHPSYWEVQSINGWRVPVERPVTVGNAAGRRFQGTHGRGTPTLPADWPQEDAIGAGLRGGPGPSGRPSHRLEAATVAPDRWRQYRERGMSFYLAWRGVRTAPKGIGP